jgi:hypothetical protein
MSTFADVVDAVDELSVDEQETLMDLLRHRIALRRRSEIVDEVAEARAEFQRGEAVRASLSEILAEVRDEP